MTMDRQIVIIGGGLAGLCAAWMLEQQGVPYRLLEARARLGGRILTVDAGFDLGPSWIWPNVQPRITDLVAELGIDTFAQYCEGDVVFHRRARDVPQRYRADTSVTGARRLAGGTSTLIEALAQRLPTDRMNLSTAVHQLQLTDKGVQVVTGNLTFEATHVIAALPPRLLDGNVRFVPELPTETRVRWQSTPTWMAPHAKFFALYDRPFWRESGLSGAAQCRVGPLFEIHDATTADGVAALFGFVGLPADERTRWGEAALTEAALNQLTLLFGSEAGHPTCTLLKDWADDPLTATLSDRTETGHPTNDSTPWVTGIWSTRLFLAGSETSEVDPGYLEGAVDAARRAVSQVLA